MNAETIGCGLIGTAVSAAGASMSVNDVQAIVSIVITIAGFVISVLVPLGIKLVQKIKKALEDKKITKEEAADILDTVDEIVEETKKAVNKDGK